MVDFKTETDIDIHEDVGRLVTLSRDSGGLDLDFIVGALKKDFVILVSKIGADEADDLMYGASDRFGLADSLELQAGFASSLGHRQNIGRYFMSPNKRADYQVITPHSEGGSFINMQLASSFCYQNNTDGGETILMNVKESGVPWDLLRERVVRGRVGVDALTPGMIAQARAAYRVDLRADALRDDDIVLEERETNIPGLKVCDVLAKPRKTRSRILNRDLFCYWDTVSSIDRDSAEQFVTLLRQWGLLKEPPGGLSVEQLDTVAPRRIRNSGVKYSDLFACRITVKWTPGDFVIWNNMTWCHAVNNWSPGSGVRKIAVSFA